MNDGAWKVVPARIGLGPQLAELGGRIARSAATDGGHSTPVPGLSLIRAVAPSQRLPVVLRPGVWLAAQGRARVLLEDAAHVLDPQHPLVLATTLPVRCQVIEASQAHPCLVLRIDLVPPLVQELLHQLGSAAPPSVDAPRPLFLARASAPLLEAALRLLRLVDAPGEAAVLAPLVLREVHYRLLAGESGGRLRAQCEADAPARRIARAIALIEARFAEPVRVCDLAVAAGLGVSALHQRFKATTALSPLQFQKRLRLEEARRLMLAGDADAARAARSVGYASPSQFSREYRRLYGAPPRREVAALRGGTG